MRWKTIKGSIEITPANHSKDIPPFILEKYLIAVSHYNLEHLNDSEEICKSILNQYRNIPDVYNLLAMINYKRKEFSVALEFIEFAISLNSKISTYYNNCAQIYRALNQNELAIKHFNDALKLEPSNSAAHHNLGIALQFNGDFKEAIDHYNQALENNPNLYISHNNLGNIFKEQRQVNLAIFHFERALAINPSYAEACNNLGRVYLDIGDTLGASKLINRSLELNPSLPEAYTNKGLICLNEGKIYNAIEYLTRALQLFPELAEAHFNLALAHLLSSNFEAGWKEYEWRWKCKDFPSEKRSFKQALWNGGSLKNKTILLYAEQGLGDTIQFIRYLPLVANYGGKIIVECNSKLIHLFIDYTKFATFIGYGESLPDFDTQLPLLSLPGIFETTLKTIPAEIDYIHIDKHLSTTWKKKLSHLKKTRIGICWQGNKNQKHDRKRSIPLSLWNELLTDKRADYISLQKGYGQEQIENNHYSDLITNYSHEMDNGEDAFADTVSIIENLDLVITSDTAIPHLAGAMDKPVWILLPHIPDWRWLLEREDSPWYPSMRLFRQKEPGNWRGVFDDVQFELDKIIEN